MVSIIALTIFNNTSKSVFGSEIIVNNLSIIINFVSRILCNNSFGDLIGLGEVRILTSISAADLLCKWLEILSAMVFYLKRYSTIWFQQNNQEKLIWISFIFWGMFKTDLNLINSISFYFLLFVFILRDLK